MKKIFTQAAIFIAILLVLQTTAFAAAAEKVVEVPDIKIIMEGKLTHYEKVPISVGGNTLLPLRELLTGLGVPNDDEHIIYNGAEKSITVLSDQTKIELYIGKKEAYLNGNVISLNVAPIIYEKNSSTYVPLRFIAETLSKKVVWDGPSRSILICDAAKFDSIKKILGKSNEEAAKIERYQMVMDVAAVTKSERVSSKVSICAESTVDKTEKKLAMNFLMSFLGLEFSMDTYYGGNTSYTQDPLSGKWIKKTFPKPEYDKLFESQSNAGMLTNSDVLCAGLSQAESGSENTILLKGDVYLTELFKNAISQQGAGFDTGIDKMEFGTFTVEILLNKDTYLMDSILMKVGMVQPADKLKGTPAITTNVDFKVKYSAYNGDFVVVIPETVLKNAEEQKVPAK